MLEILIYYAIPNFVMFGGLYALAKYIENATWYFIENYDENLMQFSDLVSKQKH